MGHRLVLVLARVRGTASGRACALAEEVAAVGRLLAAGRPRAALRRQGPRRPGPRQARHGVRHPGHRGAGTATWRVPRLPAAADVDDAGMAVPAGPARPAGDVGPLPARPPDDLRQRRVLGWCRAAAWRAR